MILNSFSGNHDICHFRFSPYKIFGLICILVKKKFQNTTLPHPTQQIRLRGADLTFFLIGHV